MNREQFGPGTYHGIIPPGEHGSARLVHDSPGKFDRLSGAMHGQPLGCEVYTRLLINNSVWMTDAEFEYRSNLVAVRASMGDVLICGLGLGFMILPVLRRDSVLSVTVIEKNSNLIALVSPHIQHPKLTVIHADAYEWTPPKRAFDFYFDIWRYIPNSDDWQDIKRLKLRYRSSLKRGGKTMAWCEDRARP